MAFGDDPFAESTVGRRGRGANNNRGGGGGGNNNNNNRNRNNRNRKNRGGGGGGVLDDSPFDTDPSDPFAGAGPGTNPFTNAPPGGGSAPPGAAPDAQPGGVGSIFGDRAGASGDTENYRGAAWGMLNQAGIGQNPIFGTAMSDWMDTEIEDLYGQWQGLSNVFGADRPQWHDFFGQTVGQDPGQYFTNRFEALPASQRGPRARNYSAPRRVIAF